MGWVSAVRIPRPPALETAEAISARPTHCMPPWMMGYCVPSSSVTLVFMSAPLSSFAAVARGPVRQAPRDSAARKSRRHRRTASTSINPKAIGAIIATGQAGQVPVPICTARAVS